MTADGDGRLTATTFGAREHARAQGGTLVDDMPWVPAASYRPLPPDLAGRELVWAERVSGGGYTNRVVARGTTIRLVDLDGDACASLLLYRADQPWERLCVADTVKVQWQAYSGSGQLLLSDQGRVLASVTGDTSGHHDAFCGTSSALRNRERYGGGSAESPTPAGHELFVLGAAKHGLAGRDIPPNVSFFKGVRVGAEGLLEWTGSAGPGAVVELRAEMSLIVLLVNVPHPLDPRAAYVCTSLEVLAWKGKPTTEHEPLWTSTPEAERAFRNTADDLDARVAP